VPSMRLAVEYQGSLSGMTLQVEKAVNLLWSFLCAGLHHYESPTTSFIFKEYDQILQRDAEKRAKW
jgi:hypothetical protein